MFVEDSSPGGASPQMHPLTSLSLRSFWGGVPAPSSFLSRQGSSAPRWKAPAGRCVGDGGSGWEGPSQVPGLEVEDGPLDLPGLGGLRPPGRAWGGGQSAQTPLLCRASQCWALAGRRAGSRRRVLWALSGGHSLTFGELV